VCESSDFISIWCPGSVEEVDTGPFLFLRLSEIDRKIWPWDHADERRANARGREMTTKPAKRTSRTMSPLKTSLRSLTAGGATAAGEDCGDPVSVGAKSREIIGSDIDKSEGG